MQPSHANVEEMAARTADHQEGRMTEVEKLVAVEEIKKLKARYARCLDTKDWVGCRAW